jgi:hypothetical protein
MSTPTASARRRRAAGGEHERTCRLVVEPLGVVDDAEHRRLVGGGREQAQRRSSDREPARGRRRADVERRCERRGLPLGEPFELRQDRPEELVQSCVGHLSLRLDTGCAEDDEAVALVERLPEKRGLPDPRLAADDEGAAVPAADRGEEARDQRPLGLPPDQHAADYTGCAHRGEDQGRPRRDGVAGGLAWSRREETEMATTRTTALRAPWRGMPAFARRLAIGTILAAIAVGAVILAGDAVAPALMLVGAVLLVFAATRTIASMALHVAADLPGGDERDRRLARTAVAGMGRAALAGGLLLALGGALA